MRSKELFTVIFRNKNGDEKKFPCYARDIEHAQDQLHKNMRRSGTYRKNYEIIEVEPGGIIAGHEVTICEGKNVEI